MLIIAYHYCRVTKCQKTRLRVYYQMFPHFGNVIQLLRESYNKKSDYPICFMKKEIMVSDADHSLSPLSCNETLLGCFYIGCFPAFLRILRQQKAHIPVTIWQKKWWDWETWENQFAACGADSNRLLSRVALNPLTSSTFCWPCQYIPDRNINLQENTNYSITGNMLCFRWSVL